MNKYISACLLSLCATPIVFASPGSGFYISIGVGGADVDYQKLESFDLDYVPLYNDIVVEDELNEAVLSNFNESAQYSDASEGVLGGRAALGYLWDIFEGEPTQIGDAIFQFNATLGLEVGYRLFETVENSLEEIEKDGTHNGPPPASPPSDECFINGSADPNCFFVYETATDKFKTQAVDLSAVLRLPFTDDNRLALLLKGGVAYNMRTVDTSIVIEADTSNPPNDFDIPYDRTVTESIDHNEFLPVYGAALEYMFYEHMGISAEYTAITGSNHNADSSLLMGNLVFRF
jgi:opacity protein-like surface antigen